MTRPPFIVTALTVLIPNSRQWIHTMDHYIPNGSLYLPIVLELASSLSSEIHSMAAFNQPMSHLGSLFLRKGLGELITRHYNGVVVSNSLFLRSRSMTPEF
ncbi:hypothetical protein HAX54_009070 [Datura stramonium]|uniref:Uncharacterized protein n=1 Tax=Datura stramonium TaxID=4076 RepID=A0ABS8TEC6_DATST|nr:hypothetical protein [Datura stramonium]